MLFCWVWLWHNLKWIKRYSYSTVYRVIAEPWSLYHWKRVKKTVCPDGKYFHQNKLFFIFTLIIFSEHSYFLRKFQITPERKQRKKIFFNSICTPPEHPNSPQSLYLWAFSQFSPLLEFNNAESFIGTFITFYYDFVVRFCFYFLYFFYYIFF